MEHMRFGRLIAEQWPVVCGVLLIAAVGGLLWWSPWEPRQAPEPVYDGHPISYWLGRDRVVPHSMVADSNAVRFLIAALNGRDSPVSRAFMTGPLKMLAPIQTNLPQPQSASSKRQNAIKLLFAMGSRAKPAIPDLIRVLKTDEAAGVRAIAGIVLGKIGRGDRAVIAALTEASTKDPHAHVRGEALLSLANAEPDPDGAASALIRALQLDSIYLRAEAAKVLGKLGRTNAVVVGALNSALGDPAPSVRSAATNALWQLDPEAAAKAHSRQPY